MKISVLTLFPEYFEPLMTTSILKRAKEKDLFEFETIDFRKFTKEKHGHVDDTPYGMLIFHPGLILWLIVIAICILRTAVTVLCTSIVVFTAI